MRRGNCSTWRVEYTRTNRLIRDFFYTVNKPLLRAKSEKKNALPQSHVAKARLVMKLNKWVCIVLFRSTGSVYFNLDTTYLSLAIRN